MLMIQVRERIFKIKQHSFPVYWFEFKNELFCPACSLLDASYEDFCEICMCRCSHQLNLLLVLASAAQAGGAAELPGHAGHGGCCELELTAEYPGCADPALLVRD